MSLDGQRLQADRYSVIPRTLVFLQDGDHVLLLRIPETRGAWKGKFNGIGGHIEQGEDALTSAIRETFEETGLKPHAMRLCGTVQIDTKINPGIALYVFVGQADSRSPLTSGTEGDLFWVPYANLKPEDQVDDLPIILPRALDAYRTNTTFSALYVYDQQDRLRIHFGG